MAAKVRVKDIYTGRRGYLDDSQYNEQMRQWAAATQSMAKRQAALFRKGKKRASRIYLSGPKKGKQEDRLRSHIRFQVRSHAGEVAGISFKFPVHGIFREYGVGRGRPRSMVSTNISDWFSGTLQRKEEGLMHIISEHQADKTLNIFMGIKKTGRRYRYLSK